MYCDFWPALQMPSFQFLSQAASCFRPYSICLRPILAHFISLIPSSSSHFIIAAVVVLQRKEIKVMYVLVHSLLVPS